MLSLIKYHEMALPEKVLPCIDGLVQERHNSSALAMQLCLSCTNPTMCQNILQSLSHSYTPHKLNVKPDKISRKGAAWNGAAMYQCVSARKTLALELCLSCTNPSVCYIIKSMFAYFTSGFLILDKLPCASSVSAFPQNIYVWCSEFF